MVERCRMCNKEGYVRIDNMWMCVEHYYNLESFGGFA